MKGIIDQIPENDAVQIEKSLPKGAGGRKTSPYGGSYPCFQLLKEGIDQLVLAGEIPVDRPHGHISPIGDHGHGHPVETVFRQEFHGHRNNLFALVQAFHVSNVMVEANERSFRLAACMPYPPWCQDFFPVRRLPCLFSGVIRDGVDGEIHAATGSRPTT